jgi:hypothetical protein
LFARSPGPSGVEKNHGLGALSAFEQKLLKEAIAELKPSIAEGIAFAAGKSRL